MSLWDMRYSGKRILVCVLGMFRANVGSKARKQLIGLNKRIAQVLAKW